MRRIAGALGVEAMSLYHHVADKDEILDGMVDLMAGRSSSRFGKEIGRRRSGAVDPQADLLGAGRHRGRATC